MTDTFTAKGTPQADHLTTIHRVGNSRRDGPSLIPRQPTPAAAGLGRPHRLPRPLQPQDDAVKPLSSGTGTELFETAAHANLTLPRTAPRPRMRRRPGGRTDNCAKACTPYELQFVKTVRRCKTPEPASHSAAGSAIFTQSCGPVQRSVASYQSRVARTRTGVRGNCVDLEYWRSETENAGLCGSTGAETP